MLNVNVDLEDKNILVFSIDEFDIDEDLTKFHLGTKRFVNIFGMLQDNLKAIIGKDEELESFQKYLDLKADYMDEPMAQLDFLERLKELYLDENLRKIILNYIEEVYDYEKTTGGTDTKKNINRQLVLNKQHCVDIQRVGAAMKYFIPIISDYHMTGETKQYTINDFYLKTFNMLLSTYNENNISNKIYKLVESRITTTKYSNKFIWNFLQNLGKDSHNTTLLLYYKIVFSLLYKLDPARNPISYIHSAIKNQLDFTFQENSEIEFQPWNPRLPEENGITSMDKMQMDYARIDEGLDAIHDINKETEIKNFLRTNPDIVVTQEDIEYYRDLEFNRFQINLVFLYFAKYFKSYDMFDLSRDELVLLIIILKKVLDDKLKLTILSKYLTAFGEFKSKKIIMKKDFLLKLSKTKIYNRIFADYKFVSKKFLEGKDPILFQISSIYFNRWLTYEDFKDGKDEYLETEEKLEEISYEILNFILQI